MGSILRHTVVFTLVSIALAGCTKSTGPAPIKAASSVSASSNNQANNQIGNNNNIDNNNSSVMPTPPPSISTKSGGSNVTNNSHYSASYSGSSSVNGSTMPNRNYSTIPKGSFSGDRYTVQRGDTLFYIAWISGNDYRTLATKNNIAEPYSLTVGQVLNVGNGNNSTAQVITPTNQNNLDIQGSQSNKNLGKMQQPTQPTENRKPIFGGKSSAPATNGTGGATVGTSSDKIVWRWPAEGKIIEGFSLSEGGNKGIDISGSRGQSVVSAADGRVVYAGNALRGYGNLIIIKHSDDYLSAYAHNDSMLVSEQQDVKAGQKIATMGSTGASSVRLHFEVRYKGKSVNPLQYLPQR